MKTTWLILVLCLAGCRPDTSSTSAVPGTPHLVELELKDGTHCVYGYNVGVTCDWRPRRQVRFEDLPASGPISRAFEKGFDGLPLPAR